MFILILKSATEPFHFHSKRLDVLDDTNKELYNNPNESNNTSSLFAISVFKFHDRSE